MILWILILTINGFAPYLGLKFNYSFAMLSNLRVDDARWNHLFVPKGLRISEHDDFIHVVHSEVHPGS